jgi:CelD/BcsL family acetyltransferase involved in cellulose biosynthesis
MQRHNNALANPFLSPEFAGAIGLFRAEARVAVLSEGPEIVGFFPFERRLLGLAAPIGAGITDCQAVIHVPGFEWDWRELLRACKIAVWPFDHLIEEQRPHGSFAGVLEPSPVIDLSAGFDAYADKLRTKSPHFFRDINRKARRLEREAGELSFVADSRDLNELHTLMGWKSAQYRRNGWVDVFDRPWIAELMDHLFSTRTDHFGGLLSVLYAGRKPVAAHFGLRSGGVLAHWFPAYDIRFGKQSPGLTQHLRMAEHLAAAGVHMIDMGTGADRYKQTLKSHDLFVAQGVMAQGPAAVRAYRIRGSAINLAREHVKRHPLLFRAADRILRRYGRVG